MKKRVFSTMVLIISAAFVLSGCSAGVSTSAKFNPKEEPTKNNIVYIMAGKIEAGEKVDITSKIPLKVQGITFDVGSTVKMGDPLIKLDAKELEAQVAQAQAGVDNANASLMKMESGARPEQLTQAKAALNTAEANYEYAKTNYENNEQLFNTGAISRAQLEQLKTSLISAEGTYKSTEAALQMLNKGESSETINLYKAQLKQAEAALELSKFQLDNATILSPINGMVSGKYINRGELATAGAPLLTVVNNEDLFINAYLPASLLNNIKIGQSVVIKVSEVPEKTFNGEILMVDPVIDSKNKNILVKVKIFERYKELMPGMFTEIGIKN